MAIGRTGSYATVEAPQDNILQAMQHVDNLDYRAKQDRKANEIAKAKKQEENLKELEEYNAKFGVTLTGNQSINDLTTSYAVQARDKAADLTRRIQTTSNQNEKAKLMNERGRLVQSFDVLKQLPTILNDKVKEISEGVEKGIYNPRDLDAVQKTLGQIDSGKAHLYVDENGQPRVTIYDTDEEGNPTSIIQKDQTIAELLSSANPYLSSKYDTANGIADQFLKQVKLDKSKVQTGFTTVTKEQMSQRVKDMATQKGKEVSTNDSEVYEIWERMGNDPKRTFTQEDRDKVAEYVTKDLLGKYNETYEKDIDQSAMTGRMNALKEDKEEKPSYNVVATPQEYASAGFNPAKGYKTVSITTQKQKPVNNITMYDKKSGDEKVYNNVFLNNYTVVKNAQGQRSVVAQITYPDVKTSTLTPSEKNDWEKFLKNPESLTSEEEMSISRITKGAEYKTKTVPLREADVVKFKSTVGASNANEMKDLARVGEEQQGSTETPQERIERLKKSKGLK